MVKKLSSLIISGFLAGVIIGLAGYCFLLLSTISKVLGALVFPIGLWLICKLNLDLYTGKIGYFKETYIWTLIIMLVSNLLGAFLFGLLIHWLNPSIGETALNLLNSKNLTDWEYIIRCFVNGFFCGALVYLAVYSYKTGTSEAGKFLGVYLPIFVFVLCGFEHCVADMFYVGAALTYNPLCAFSVIILPIISNSLGAILTRISVDFCRRFRG